MSTRWATACSGFPGSWLVLDSLWASSRITTGVIFWAWWISKTVVSNCRRMAPRLPAGLRPNPLESPRRTLEGQGGVCPINPRIFNRVQFDGQNPERRRLARTHLPVTSSGQRCQSKYLSRARSRQSRRRQNPRNGPVPCRTGLSLT